MEQQLSKRLLAIASLIPPGSLVADIGTDHAFLPVYLVQKGIVPRAIAGDVHPGPFKMALRTVADAGLTAKIQVRLGNGLEVLQAPDMELESLAQRETDNNVGETDNNLSDQTGAPKSKTDTVVTAVIAGMGGGTIQMILAADPKITGKLDYLVLQPMVDAGPLRAWLLTQGWQLVAEDLVEEEGRIYEILAAQPATKQEKIMTDQVLLEVGPLLLVNHHPLLGRHLDKLIEDKKRMLAQLANSNSELAKEKETWAQNWLNRLLEIKETLTGGA